MKIRDKILLSILSVCLFSVLSLSITSFNTNNILSNNSRNIAATINDNAVAGSSEALTDQAHDFLQILAREQAKLCDDMLGAIKLNVLLMEGVVQDIFNNPHAYSYNRPIHRPSELTGGGYGNTYFLSENIPMTPEIEREIGLLSNMNLLMPMLASNPNVIELYVGMESGLFYNYTAVTSESPGYDPRVRPWYLAALENPDNVVLTEVYEDAFGNGMVLTVAKAIHGSDGTLIGVAALDILLTNLKEMIENIRISASGYAFIIDSDGQYIVHPDMGQEEFEPFAIGSESRASLAEGYSRMMNGEEGFCEGEIGGEKVFMTFSPISVAGWSVGLIVHEDELLAPLKMLAVQMDEQIAEANEEIVNIVRRTNIILAVIIAAVIILTFILSINLTRIILRPVSSLTSASRLISEGNLEADIPYSPKRKDELGVLSMALHRMVEQFRVSAVKQTQAQAITAAGLRCELFISAANSVPQAFKMVQSLLHYQYKHSKTTLVYTGADDFYALTRCVNEAGESVTTEAADYPHHAQVIGLLSGKKFVFCNAFTLKQQNLTFASENARLVCLAALAAEERPKGYIIIESFTDDELSVAREEEFLLYLARELSAWISAFEKKPGLASELHVKGLTALENSSVDGGGEITAEAASPPEDNLLLKNLRTVEGLELDMALEVMGQLEDVYERSVRLFARLTPETIQKMDDFIETNPGAFATEIHGMKGSLSNIGAYALAASAGDLENAAKSGRLDAFKDSYQSFRAELLDFHQRLDGAMPESGTLARAPGNTASLLELLRSTREAADAFDTYKALGIIENARESSYGSEADSMIAEIISFLESYDIDQTIAAIDKLQMFLEAAEK